MTWKGSEFPCMLLVSGSPAFQHGNLLREKSVEADVFPDLTVSRLKQRPVGGRCDCTYLAYWSFGCVLSVFNKLKTHHQRENNSNRYARARKWIPDLLCRPSGRNGERQSALDDKNNYLGPTFFFCQAEEARAGRIIYHCVLLVWRRPSGVWRKQLTED